MTTWPIDPSPHTDIDGDGVISRKDLDKVLNLITDSKPEDEDGHWEATKRVIIDGVRVCSVDALVKWWASLV